MVCNYPVVCMFLYDTSFIDMYQTVVCVILSSCTGHLQFVYDMLLGLGVTGVGVRPGGWEVCFQAALPVGSPLSLLLPIQKKNQHNLHPPTYLYTGATSVHLLN